MSTPSEELAAKIRDRLVKEKLLAPNDAAKLEATLAEGKMKSEDWRLAIELAQEKRQKS